MFAGFLGWAGGAWNWFIKSPLAQAIAFALGVVLAWSVAVKALKEEGKREQRRIHDVANANERAEMAQTHTEIIHDIDQRIEGAEAAVERLPQFRSSRELREFDPELAALILGPTESDGASGS